MLMANLSASAVRSLMRYVPLLCDFNRLSACCRSMFPANLQGRRRDYSDLHAETRQNIRMDVNAMFQTCAYVSMCTI